MTVEIDQNAVPDRNSDLYKYYFNTQYIDTEGEQPDIKYLDYLTKVLMPNEDFTKMKVLDVGARIFTSWDYFKALGNDDVVGIDIGKRCLDLCEAAGKPCFNQDAHFMMERFQPETFDLIISFHALEHMFSPGTVLKNIHQALKTGGIFYMALPSPSGTSLNPWLREGHWVQVDSDEQVKAMIINSGFKADDFIHSAHYSGELRPADEYVCVVRK